MTRLPELRPSSPTPLLQRASDLSSNCVLVPTGKQHQTPDNQGIQIGFLFCYVEYCNKHGRSDALDLHFFLASPLFYSQSVANFSIATPTLEFLGFSHSRITPRTWVQSETALLLGDSWISHSKSIAFNPYGIKRKKLSKTYAFFHAFIHLLLQLPFVTD